MPGWSDCQATTALITSALQSVAQQFGIDNPLLGITPGNVIDTTLKATAHGSIEQLEIDLLCDLQLNFVSLTIIDSFAHPDGKSRLQSRLGNNVKLARELAAWVVVGHAKLA